MKALGLIETRGLLSAVDAADAMLKAADVRLLEENYVGGGLVTVTVTGEVAAVQAAVAAAVSSVARIAGATLVSAHVIARPDVEVGKILALEPRLASGVDEPMCCCEATVTASSANRTADLASPDSPVDLREIEETTTDAPVRAAPVSAERHAKPAGLAKGRASGTGQGRYNLAQLKTMNVNKLRPIARAMPGLSLSGEEVKTARKKDLLDAIIHVYRQIEE